jgi:hypothetical protein
MAALALPEYRLPMTLTEDQYGIHRSYYVGTSAALSQRREKSFWFPAAAGKYNVVVLSSQVPMWVEPTLRAYSQIQELADDWDSYGAKKVNHDLIRSSLLVLTQVMGPLSPVPSVVPLADGGLQLEWHRKQQDLEIVFPVDDTPQFIYQNRATGEEREGFANDVSSLVQLLRDMA